MQTNQTTYQKTILFSIGMTSTVLLMGIISFIYIHNRVTNQVITGTSTLGEIQQQAQTQKKQTVDLKTIIYENQKRVVQIQFQTKEGDVVGSGFLYNDKGDVITNAHVVSATSKVNVKMSDTTLYKGNVIGKSEEMDIALVRVPELAGKEPVKIAKEQAEVGDEVIALGSPLGLQNTATTGIISGINRDLTIENSKYKDVYQFSAPITHGNSGGPLIDQNTGEVLGVNFGGRGEANIGFSIPIVQVLSLVENWSNNPATNDENTQNYTYEEEGEVLSIEQSTEYVVRYFYNSINSQDYVTAYSLLGSSWQGKISYKNFRSGYLNTMSVEVKNATAQQISEDQAKVTMIIEAVERIDGIERTSQYKVKYEVGRENDKIKILKGEGEKIV